MQRTGNHGGWGLRRLRDFRIAKDESKRSKTPNKISDNSKIIVSPKLVRRSNETSTRPRSHNDMSPPPQTADNGLATPCVHQIRQSRIRITHPYETADLPLPDRPEPVAAPVPVQPLLRLDHGNSPFGRILHRPKKSRDDADVHLRADAAARGLSRGKWKTKGRYPDEFVANGSTVYSRIEPLLSRGIRSG